MSKSLCLQLARKLADSSVPLAERAHLARQIRETSASRLVGALTLVIIETEQPRR